MKDITHPDLDQTKAAINAHSVIMMQTSFGYFIHVTKKEALRLTDMIFRKEEHDQFHLMVDDQWCFIANLEMVVE